MIVARQFIAWLRSFSPSGTKSDNPFRDKTRQAPYGMNSRPIPRPRAARSASLPATRVQFGLGAVLQHSNTPSLQHSNTPLRAAGSEDEGDDSLPDEACGL